MHFLEIFTAIVALATAVLKLWLEIRENRKNKTKS
jgi:hypothetical protein